MFFYILDPPHHVGCPLPAPLTTTAAATAGPIAAKRVGTPANAGGATRTDLGSREEETPCRHRHSGVHLCACVQFCVPVCYHGCVPESVSDCCSLLVLLPLPFLSLSFHPFLWMCFPLSLLRILLAPSWHGPRPLLCSFLRCLAPGSLLPPEFPFTPSLPFSRILPFVCIRISSCQPNSAHPAILTSSIARSCLTPPTTRRAWTCLPPCLSDSLQDELEGMLATQVHSASCAGLNCRLC
jgi:hypothetical protein